MTASQASLDRGRDIAEARGASLFETIIVGFDGSPDAQRALALAERLRRPQSGRIVLARVLRPGAADLATGTPQGTVVVAAPSTAEGLHELAASERADLIVVGRRHGHFFPHAAQQAFVYAMTDRAPCAVAFAGAEQPLALTTRARVMVAFDGGAASRAALATAFNVAAGVGADVEICHALEPFELPEERRARERGQLLTADERAAQRELDLAAAQAPAGVVAWGRVLFGHPVAALLRAAHGADVLVAGSRAVAPLERVFVGTVSGRLVTADGPPVLVVPVSAHRAIAEQNLLGGR